MTVEGDDPRGGAKPSLSAGDDLSVLSLEDLRERIDALRDEIRRTEAALDAKQGAMGAAEAVFKS